jgi:hypothetical protein
MNIMPFVFFCSSQGHSAARECQPDTVTPTLLAYPWTLVPHAVQARRSGHVLRRSDYGRVPKGASLRPHQRGKQEGMNVLRVSVITLYDINPLEHESNTYAVFMEKPQLHDRRLRDLKVDPGLL